MPVSGFTGKNAYIKFGTTELQTYYRTAGPTREIDLVDKSAGPDTSKTYLTALIDGTMDLVLVMPEGTAGTALLAALSPGTSGTLEWGPEGTAAGKPKNSVTAIVRRRGEPLEYAGVTTLAVSFQFSGDVTESSY